MSAENTQKQFDELLKKSDHELLAHIAMETIETNRLLKQLIVSTSNLFLVLDRQEVLGSKISPKLDQSTLGDIAHDMRLLRRHLVGSSQSDPEER